jgi:hypothetical protein
MILENMLLTIKLYVNSDPRILLLNVMTSATNQAQGHKRKAIPTSSAGRKRQKTHDIREISVQSSDAAISTTGELDVASFVKAREYEIGALEKSMQKTKKALTMRAFQQVPRAMRRRTASHNVKKVPRRLRRRAEREVSDRNDRDVELHLVVIVADEGILVR